MSRGVLTGLAAFAVLVLIVGFDVFNSGFVFTVHQAQQALVLQFGEPRRVVREPGLRFKIPFVQNVAFYDRRVLEFDVPSEEVIASDQKRLVVDSFARYRIVDPLRFFQAVGNEAVVRTRLAPIINAGVRRALGNVPLGHIVSGERVTLMATIRDIVNTDTEKFGIEIVDVRIKRTDLPEENSLAIYRRMQTERERKAKELRAEGEEEGQKITAAADRDKVVLIAEARKKAQILRGEGDGDAIRIFADAFGRDVQFFAFYRSMEAYREALGADDTTMVLSPDSEFFRFFGDMTGGAAAGSPRE